MKKHKGLTPITCDLCGREVERWKACDCWKMKDREQELIQEMRQDFLDRWIELKDAVLDDDVVLALEIAGGLLEELK